MNPEYIKLCSIPAVQEKIREVMGEWRKGDMYVVGGKRYFFGDATWWYPGGKIPESFVRLPQVHDLNDEKRGLWGMVDWDLFSTLTPSDGQWYIFGMPDRWTKGFCTEWQAPEIALLRCLCYQWGISYE